MARLGSVNKNNRRRQLAEKSASRRDKLKEVIYDKNVDFEARIEAVIKLSELPRNSSATRIRNRCEVSGRPRGFHRKFRMSRIAVRELGSLGLIPGLIKSSW
ncbi:30S ribosomal protein S14 [Candidatus Paracaedibacter symbiosus]|uniref:30S ribosomal protein S14 n=1 Tax=Candidatus Paracaedibacter symbiosus TaxID=244582 RepID=UPI00050943CA|nr:30S ribosomal protein S14 [Candidatus Paracaedibacter symbiosus]